MPFRSTHGRQQTYLTGRAILEHGTREEQLALAQSRQAAPEMLYYLAEHGDGPVRQAVAANPATPIQADTRLTSDPIDEVRAQLALKIGRMLPDLADGAKAKLREQAIAIIEALAQDQAPRVRILLVEAIKASPHIPHAVARQLAEDPELLVCGPILEYSPLLGDADLMEIIAAGRARDALDCIARREPLGADVCDAIGRTGHTAAVAALLANSNAQIREDTLDLILDQAPQQASWHEPLVLRATLSTRAMRRIAGFVASALVERMVQAQVVEPVLARELLGTVRQQIDTEPLDAGEQAMAADQAKLVIDAGQFNDDWVLEQIAANRAVVIAALGLASGIGVVGARKLISGRQARAIMALSWKAGLSARTGYRLQQDLAHVPAIQQLVPVNGDEYPATASDMEWLLEAYG
jgi:uncharacterized protein (DUF2336 family)